ncbi:MAG: signal peptidase II [Eubacteriales bacterium]|nr:signal peptidase II [Eubacteriales bacterium]
MSDLKKRKTVGLVLYLVLVTILTELDQITKIIAENILYKNDDIPVIKGVLEFSYLRNDGSAFGMFSGKINLFLVLTVIVVAFITYIIIRMPMTKKYYPVYLMCTLLVSGALGNFIDRIRFGYVRDFIYFKLIDFPVFNVADCYVTVSVILLIISILFVYDEEDFKFLSSKKINDTEDAQESVEKDIIDENGDSKIGQ